MARKIVAGIGEILWDVFPDGPRFGGAPSNFACSTAQMAGGVAEVFMVSAVGADALGQQAVDALAGHGVNTSCVQTSERPTGQVLVELDEAGIASYRFAENCAWDHLEFSAASAQLAPRCDAVCFGTLGQRAQRSREAIGEFVAAMPKDAFRILDVNLRPPFFDDPLIRQSLQLANVLKLNDEELPRLAALVSASGNETDVLRRLADEFQLRAVALTRGSHGALILSGEEVSDLAGSSVSVADTVGAGDAYTASFTLGLLAGRSVHEVNQRAIEVASYVCSQSGATPDFPRRLLEDPLP